MMSVNRKYAYPGFSGFPISAGTLLRQPMRASGGYRRRAELFFVPYLWLVITPQKNEPASLSIVLCFEACPARLK